MLKEFFLVDYNAINSFKEISEPLLDIATSSFLLIAAVFELFKGFVGKSNVETRVTIFILAAISMTAFNQYNQKILDISFTTSDKILSKLHITSMTKISDIMKSSPADQIKKNDENVNDSKKTKASEPTNVLGEARIFIANNLAIAVAWLISVIAIGLSRILFTVIYYALIVLSPIIIFISVFPGFEGSLKAFWQAFIWCFLAPIVFSVIFVLMHLIAQKENPSILGGLESLINVLLYGIFLVGSFIMTYKISTSQPLTGFAEKASMVGAMAMAAPFTSVTSFTQSAIHSPLQTYANSKYALGKMNKGISKLSQNSTPHSGIGDISKMNQSEIEKKFGDKTASKLYSHNALNDYMGNSFGLNHPGINKALPSTTTANPANPPYSISSLENRKFEIDPNTLNAKEVGAVSSPTPSTSRVFLPREKSSSGTLENGRRLSPLSNHPKNHPSPKRLNTKIASNENNSNNRPAGTLRKNNFKPDSLKTQTPKRQAKKMAINTKPSRENLNGNI